MSKIEAKKIALHIVSAARSKKARDIKVLDMRKVCGFCDYFVLMSATSLRQAGAVAEAINEALLGHGVKSLSGLNPNDESGWMALDYSSVIAHIFTEPMREFYALDRLWSEARKVRLPRQEKG
ncbi:MAG: ribosome silencing factor [Candidatus Omnitrophota bacterium]